MHEREPGRVDREVRATYRGTVDEGVEAGVLVMQTDDGLLNLLASDDDTIGIDRLVPGAFVEVYGQLSPRTVTIGMQGTPFLVERVRRVRPPTRGPSTRG